MKGYRLFSIILIFCIELIPCMGQGINFNHLSTREGLSHYSVMSLYQDHKGLIWIGTRNGLNLYDGKGITTYKHNLNNKNSIQSNSIRQIVGDKQRYIYILTIRGLSVFDTQTEQFKLLTQNSVSTIYYHKQLYIGIENKVYAYNDGRFTLVCSMPIHDYQVTSLYVDNQHVVIGTRKHGCFTYNKKNKTITRILDGEDEIIKIFKDSHGRCWIGTLNNGLFMVYGAQNEHYQSVEGDSHTLCSNYVRDICEDKTGNIWIGTFRGLNKHEPNKKDFVSYPNTSRNTLTTSSSVWSLLCDNQGNMWVGTYFGGVDYFNPSGRIYHHYNVASQETRGLSSPIVGAMTEDNYHHIWICTEGGGLNCFNPKTSSFKWYKQSGNFGISQNNVKTVCFDKARNCLWIGTHLGGLNRMDLGTGRFTHYQYKNLQTHQSNIICKVILYQNKLLLATHNGVLEFNPTTEKFTPMFKDGREGDVINFALDLCIDHRGILWIGGAERGAYSYNFATRKLKLYQSEANNPSSLSSNGINCIYEDCKQRLWFCTSESGLDLYNEKTDGFSNYNEKKHNLLSNCIYGVCSDQTGKLYIITDCGLSTLDIKTNRVENYTVNKSIPLSAVNQNAIFLASDNHLYIGGVDGMLAINPVKLAQNTPAYHIFPHKLFIYDKEVSINDETGILKKSLSQTEELTLKASQAMFSIQYAITNYSPFNQDKIIYRLENFSQQWTTLRNERLITYTNLAPGDYLLVVKAVDKQGQDKVISRIKIHILPPLYKAWWAI